MKELAIIMPLYNEADSIEGVVHKWITEFHRLDIAFELHAYNDGSRDDSLIKLKALADHFPELVVHNKVNSGHGPTILQGYREQGHFPWLFQIDSDDELDIVGFEAIWNSRENHDFLIGDRGNRNSPPARSFITWVTRLTVELFYGKGVQDVNCPFRLMRSATFNRLFDQIPESTFAPNVIISGYVALKKLRFKEVRIQHQFRTTGEVSIRKWKLFRAAFLSFWQTVKFRFRL
mgnify:FL=1